MDLKCPSCLKKLRSHIGCFSYYRRFILQFSIIAETLYALTRKGEKFKRTSKQWDAFKLLKRSLTEAPVLALPRDEAPTILDVDTCDTGIGAVVSQIIDGFTDAERNYCITRREALSLIFELKTFLTTLFGSWHRDKNRSYTVDNIAEYANTISTNLPLVRLPARVLF